MMNVNAAAHTALSGATRILRAIGALAAPTPPRCDHDTQREQASARFAGLGGAQQRKDSSSRALYPIVCTAAALLWQNPAVAGTQRTYNELKARAITKYIKTEVTVKGQKLMMNAYVVEGINLSKMYFDRSVYVASKLALEQISRYHTVSCDTNASVDVIQISFETMNTPGLITFKQESLGTLWGFFDPGVYGDKYTILVASHTLNSTHTVIAHEIAHYWFERLCVSDSRGTTSEQFARTIEDQYVDYFNSDQPL